MNKAQFNELLASVKQMDEMVARAKKESKTDWERLSKMKEINTEDITELGDDFFRDTQIRMPSDKQSEK